MAARDGHDLRYDQPHDPQPGPFRGRNHDGQPLQGRRAAHATGSLRAGEQKRNPAEGTQCLAADLPRKHEFLAESTLIVLARTDLPGISWSPGFESSRRAADGRLCVSAARIRHAGPAASAVGAAPMEAPPPLQGRLRRLPSGPSRLGGPNRSRCPSPAPPPGLVRGSPGRQPPTAAALPGAARASGPEKPRSRFRQAGQESLPPKRGRLQPSIFRPALLGPTNPLPQ